MSNDFARYAQKLRRIPMAVKARQPAAAAAGARIVRAEVEARAPVDDGELKRSIRDRAGEETMTSAEHLVVVGVFYAGWVERGHGGPKRAGPHPFFRPAFDSKEAEARRVITKMQMDALKDAMK